MGKWLLNKSRKGARGNAGVVIAGKASKIRPVARRAALNGGRKTGEPDNAARHRNGAPRPAAFPK